MSEQTNIDDKLDQLQRAEGPLLEVKDLQVDFTTDDGRAVHADF